MRLCKHPDPRFEGNGYSKQFWHCPECGKKYSMRGHYDGKEAQWENAFYQGAEAFLEGKTLFDNPYSGVHRSMEAWQKGFRTEARRFHDPE